MKKEVRELLIREGKLGKRSFAIFVIMIIVFGFLMGLLTAIAKPYLTITTATTTTATTTTTTTTTTTLPNVEETVYGVWEWLA